MTFIKFGRFGPLFLLQILFLSLSLSFYWDLLCICRELSFLQLYSLAPDFLVCSLVPLSLFILYLMRHCAPFSFISLSRVSFRSLSIFKIVNLKVLSSKSNVCASSEGSLLSSVISHTFWFLCTLSCLFSLLTLSCCLFVY